MLLRLQNSFASMTEGVRQQERIANNLANANTVGFKRERLFVEALNERLDAEQAPRSDRAITRWADAGQGALEKTDNPLDVAIHGDGFFVVTDEATGRTGYTRAGRFTLDADGVLRDAAGRLVEGEGGPIEIPPDQSPIVISTDGEVRAGDEVVGRLRVVTFADPMALTRAEGAVFLADEARPVDVPTPDLRQGFVESSNVDVIREMTDMITHFRLFESQQKVIQTLDQVLGQVSRDLGRF
ncbi:flagellar basal-body rod protein FlgF [Rhodothermaceae bacterium RA]|nr:flagellar basal-body rod protein FlgF [Rhodothermaceae bacterium RA]